MDHLSSCYFCGAALDKRLREYVVVPESLRTDEDAQMATLCPACHRKLETVLGAVVDTEDATLAAATKSHAGSTTPDGPADETHDEAVDGDPDAILEEPSADEADATVDDALQSGEDMWDAAATDVASETTGGGESGTTDDTDERLETTDDAETDAPDDTDEPVTVDDVAALAGNVDPTAAEDDEDVDQDTDSSTEATEETDTVTAEDIDDLAGDIDSDILEDDEEPAESDDPLQSAMEPDMPDEFEASASGDETVDDGAASETDPLVDDLGADVFDDSTDVDDTNDTDDTDDDLESAMEADVPAELQSDDDGPTPDSDDGTGRSDPAADTSDAAATDRVDEAAADTSSTADTADVDTDTTDIDTDTADAGPDTTDTDTSGANDGGVDGSDGTETPTADESGDASTQDDSEPARTSISALEYNKVMRLLQNRQFPVEREEIEAVAANAYGLSHAECAEVIDLAVDRGLIGEDGDNLVRSE